jgi:hypothetical protein
MCSCCVALYYIDALHVFGSKGATRAVLCCAVLCCAVAVGCNPFAVCVECKCATFALHAAEYPSIIHTSYYMKLSNKYVL